MRIRRHMVLHLTDGDTRQIDLDQVQSVRDGLSLQFESGVNLDVDLSKVQMTAEQRAAVDKLAREVRELSVTECTAEEGCPAQKFLSAEEFEKVRGLKATLGSGGTSEARGVIVDFCLHAIVIK